MRLKRSAADFLPERVTLPALREAAQTCEGCDLYKRATQVVFGEGPRKSAVMLVGEVPGDQEDRQGKPFVGPAGKLLDEALHEVGLDRKETYVTNAVKHFSWQERGKRRLHKKPKWSEVQACKPWLQAEILAVAPKLVICLGATAAQSLLGADFRITQRRGELLESELAAFVMATYHPSAILRAPDKDDRDRMRLEFVDDLRRAIQRLAA
jgi:uracil-DNA glycosylase